MSDAVKALNDFKLKDMSTTQQILNQSVELKQQSAKDRHSIQLIQNINFCTIAVTFNYFFDYRLLVRLQFQTSELHG